MFDFKLGADGKVVETSVLRDALAQSDAENRPAWLFVEAFHRFLAIFIADLGPEQAITNAAYVIAFLGYWETAICK